MSETSDGKSLRDRGVEFSAATRSEAKRWAEELNDSGKAVPERVQHVLDELLGRFDQFQESLRTDIEQWISSQADATRAEVERLEARVAQLTSRVTSRLEPRASSPSARPPGP
jgi:polyhydroxyalkanoate synthesis regulator phasin